MVRPGLAAKVGTFCDLCNFLSSFLPKSSQFAGNAPPHSPVLAGLKRRCQTIYI